jgi:hypothetical protein
MKDIEELYSEIKSNSGPITDETISLIIHKYEVYRKSCNDKILSRTALANSIFRMHNELVKLGWAIHDGIAKREDVFKIGKELDEVVNCKE